MPEVLFVSKPVVPPWNDSSKNLVRDLASGLTRYRPVVLGRRGGEVLAKGRTEPLYPAEVGRFAPALRDNARVLGRLLLGRRTDLWHFFFAPNPKSSLAGTIAQRAKRVPSVHTICSAPLEGADLNRVLFADRNVVLSRHTHERFLMEGFPSERLRRIPPAIDAIAPLGSLERRQARVALGLSPDSCVITYPGDLEFGGGAARILEAFGDIARSGLQLAMACRVKTPAAREVEAELRARCAAMGLGASVRWIGETPHIHALLGASDVVALPSTSLYAKMDYPLVLLEAMSMERAVIVASGTAAEELSEGEGARAVEPSREALGDALRELVEGDQGRRTLGRTAREVVLKRYTRATMAAAYESLYDELSD